MNVEQETIATLRLVTAQAWATRSGGATNKATQSWVAGARADKVRLASKPFNPTSPVQTAIDRVQYAAIAHGQHGYGGLQ